jgi:hypothetical protein
MLDGFGHGSFFREADRLAKGSTKAARKASGLAGCRVVATRVVEDVPTSTTERALRCHYQRHAELFMAPHIHIHAQNLFYPAPDAN